MKTVKDNEKNIDSIMKEYAAAAGKAGSDKRRHLSGLYRQKKTVKSTGNVWSSSKMKRFIPVCVSAVVILAMFISVPVIDSIFDRDGFVDSYLDNDGVLDPFLNSYEGNIQSSSSSNGGVFDSISSWLESLKGDKGDAGDKGDKGNVGDKPNGGGSSEIMGGNPPVIIQLGEKKRNEIIDAYYNDVKAENQNVKREDIVLDFFVAINEAYAIRINAGWLYECKPSSETVGGVEFNYAYSPAESYGIKIYYDGKFYRLAEAFDAGIINTDALYVIRDAYKNR